ncbi:NAD(P)-dependent oxidoreductase [Escherichia coli]
MGPDWYGTDVHHKTLGIVGMGRIGMALAQRAHFGFNMPILYNARRHHKEAEERFNARYCDLDTLLQESDFVCLILPLTDETHHLFGAEQFAKMKSPPFSLMPDVARWLMNDLIAALQKGEIHAAGLDVFEQEPLSVDSPLLSMANVVAEHPDIGFAHR